MWDWLFSPAFCWVIDTLIRYPLVSDGVPAIVVVTFEHGILAALTLFILFRARQRLWHLPLGHLFYFLIVGCFGSALSVLAFTHAFSLVNPSVVILLQKAQPVVAVILARIVLGESIQKAFILWGLVCMGGALLVSADEIFYGSEFVLPKDKDGLMGVGLALFAVLCWGSATVFGKKLIELGHETKEIMAMRFLFGFLVLIPFCYNQNPMEWAKGPIIADIALMALISGPVAMGLYYTGLGKISARSCAIAEMFFPLCAVVVNWLRLEATLAPPQILGGILLTLGAFVIQQKNY